MNTNPAHNRGYKARADNLSQSQNPYISPAHIFAWDCGWKEADEFLTRGNFMNMLDKSSLLNPNNPVMKAFRR